MKARLRIGLAACLSLAAIGTAGAVVGQKGPRRAEPPYVGLAGQRAHRTIEHATAARMASSGLPGWTAILDRDTGVPLQMWGAGVAAPGAVAGSTAAEAAARAFLRAHLHVIAPGATESDFVLVTNKTTNGIRSVGFEQRAGGLRVVGGQVGFAFVNDRLAMVTSTALPHVVVAHAAKAPRAAAFSAARHWLAGDGFAITSRDPATSAAAPPVILPIIRPRTKAGMSIEYRVAHQLSVEDTRAHERWNVWIDAATSAPIQRVTTISKGIAKVLYDVPERGPQGTRRALPAARANMTIAGANVLSELDGGISFTGNGPVDVTLGLTGPRVLITNNLPPGNAPPGEPLHSETKPIANGGTLTFTAASELIDGQLAAFVHANAVKEYARTVLDPTLPWIDQQLIVGVNEDGACNAFSTLDDIHFFRANSLDLGNGTVLQCENTARISDVVYHEFGHSLHGQSILPGVGQFHPSVSEGLGDFMSSLMTNDSGLARGFFVDQPETALRDLDPVGLEKRFPDDATGEPHDEGEIIGGALYDLKKALEAKLGVEAGRLRVAKIFYNIMQRSVDLPSTYGEAMLADDDDGNLANGTPNQCEIDAAFAIHGLADQSALLGIVPPTREGLVITAPVNPPAMSACLNLPTLSTVTVDWNVRGQAAQSVTLTKTGDAFSGSIPAQPDGTVIQYKVTYTLSNGSSLSFPTGNPSETFLEFYVGPVRPIACFDFESGAQGWTGDATGQWKAGTPLGLGGDPTAAHGGTGVFGLDLDEDGVYFPDTLTTAESPEIDLKGATKVRLQYHRWLNVEMGVFEQARILANDVEVWTNAGTLEEPSQANFTDREWRFSDIDLGAQAASGKIKLRFELQSDPFLELGGWTMDNVCIVEAVAPGCGNGVVETSEQCDDGNVTVGDGCSATCQTEDPIEPPPPDEDGGCCSAGGSPVASFGLGAFVLGLALRRRRRRSEATTSVQ